MTGAPDESDEFDELDTARGPQEGTADDSSAGSPAAGTASAGTGSTRPTPAANELDRDESDLEASDPDGPGTDDELTLEAAALVDSPTVDDFGGRAGGSTGVHPDTVKAADYLEDLRRLQAEYVNYKRRVDRDRSLARESGVQSVVEALLPVLDDVHLAREHGDLEEGPFAAVADKLEAILGRFGVVSLGAPGQEFDPAIHEALMHVEASAADLPEGATTTTVVQVLQPGYKVGDRVVRPARVSVADPQ